MGANARCMMSAAGSCTCWQLHLLAAVPAVDAVRFGTCRKWRMHFKTRACGQCKGSSPNFSAFATGHCRQDEVRRHPAWRLWLQVLEARCAAAVSFGCCLALQIQCCGLKRVAREREGETWRETPSDNPREQACWPVGCSAAAEGSS